MFAFLGELSTSRCHAMPCLYTSFKNCCAMPASPNAVKSASNSVSPIKSGIAGTNEATLFSCFKKAIWSDESNPKNALRSLICSWV